MGFFEGEGLQLGICLKKYRRWCIEGHPDMLIKPKK